MRLASVRNPCLPVESVDEIDVIPALDRRGNRPVFGVEAVDRDDPLLALDEDLYRPD